MNLTPSVTLSPLRLVDMNLWGDFIKPIESGLLDYRIYSITDFSPHTVLNRPTGYLRVEKRSKEIKAVTEIPLEHAGEFRGLHRFQCHIDNQEHDKIFNRRIYTTIGSFFRLNEEGKTTEQTELRRKNIYECVKTEDDTALWMNGKLIYRDGHEIFSEYEWIINLLSDASPAAIVKERIPFVFFESATHLKKNQRFIRHLMKQQKIEGKAYTPFVHSGHGTLPWIYWVDGSLVPVLIVTLTRVYLLHNRAKEFHEQILQTGKPVYPILSQRSLNETLNVRSA